MLEHRCLIILAIVDVISKHFLLSLIFVFKARTNLYEAPCRVPESPSINALGY